MGKSFEEIMKVLAEKGEIPDEKAKAIIAEHGPLSDDEKKELAAVIKMKKALDAKSEAEEGEVSLDDYIQALSVLDAEGASEEEKKQAKQIKEKFENQ